MSRSDIKAFRFGFDDFPDWFSELLMRGQAVISRGTAFGVGLDSAPCLSLKTAEGSIKGETGDFIVKQADGNIKIYKPQEFTEMFEKEN